jgi:hypothetical protein
MAGVFVADAGAGFPPGAPAGAPQISWHGVLHEVGFVLATLSTLAACLVFARRFAATGQRGWVGFCLASAAAVVVLAAWPDLDGVSVRLVVASAIMYGFVGALAAHLLRGLPDRAG